MSQSLCETPLESGVLGTGTEVGEKRKNRTLLQTGRRAIFYECLTENHSFAGTGKGFRAKERELLATEIGFGATGILGVFRACTPRSGYMYI